MDVVEDDYNHVTIKLTNSGSATCSMRGFPGVDLKGRNGTTSAQRSEHTTSAVTLAPGHSAAFDLEVLQNNTGGSRVSFDQTVITPPNETHSHTMQLGFNLPVQADGNSTTPARRGTDARDRASSRGVGFPHLRFRRPGGG